MRARKLPTALLATAIVGAGLLFPSGASAGTGSVECETTGPAPYGTNLYSYACYLVDTAPANEVWRAPALSPGSNGTAVARGVCHTVTRQFAYYPTVTYTNSGTPETASTTFLCSNMV